MPGDLLPLEALVAELGDSFFEQVPASWGERKAKFFCQSVAGLAFEAADAVDFVNPEDGPIQDISGQG